MSDPQIKALMDKLDELIKALKEQGKINYIHIEHADIQGPLVDRLDYHFDTLDVKEVSGALNLGTTFGVKVSEKKKKKPKPSDGLEQREQNKNPETGSKVTLPLTQEDIITEKTENLPKQTDSKKKAEGTSSALMTNHPKRRTTISEPTHSKPANKHVRDEKGAAFSTLKTEDTVDRYQQKRKASIEQSATNPLDSRIERALEDKEQRTRESPDSAQLFYTRKGIKIKFR